MAQRTVCLCDGKYIGIETIFTVVDGRQINIPGKVEELRTRSRKNELFCPCGCGSNLILVAGDKNLREQHFRLKDGPSNANCSAVTEGSVSLNSKIVLKCWLDDKLHATDLETRVPVRSLENGSLNSKNGGRKYEFSFLSAEKKIALSYTHERANLSDEKFDALESNHQEIQILYVVDEANGGNTGQYPEGLMKIQRRQGHLLFLNIKGSNYAEATLRAAFYEKDIDGHWQELTFAEDALPQFDIDENGVVIYAGKALELYREDVRDSFRAKQEELRKRREEERRRRALEEERRKQRERERLLREEEQRRARRQREEEERRARMQQEEEERRARELQEEEERRAWMLLTEEERQARLQKEEEERQARILREEEERRIQTQKEEELKAARKLREEEKRRQREEERKQRKAENERLWEEEMDRQSLERARRRQEAAEYREKRRDDIEKERQRLEEEYQRYLAEGRRQRAEREAEARKRDENFRRNMEAQFSQQEKPVYDRDGNRWIRCEFCGKIDRDSSFVSYGGKNHVNLGTCKECEANNPAVREKAAAAKMQAARRRDQNSCPECGGTLTLRNGRFGSFYGCSNFPACRYTRRA